MLRSVRWLPRVRGAAATTTTTAVPAARNGISLRMLAAAPERDSWVERLRWQGSLLWERFGVLPFGRRPGETCLVAWDGSGAPMLRLPEDCGCRDVDDGAGNRGAEEEEEEEGCSLWRMAVPKQKVTRHKKRLKTTVQKRLEPRSDIVVDPRTGEVTLRHRLPFNWKDYLPEAAVPEAAGSDDDAGTRK